MTQFKVGDFVVCVDPPLDAKDIVKGRVYTVRHTYGEFVTLENTKGGNWLCSRFEPAPTPMDSLEYEDILEGQAILEGIERGK